MAAQFPQAQEQNVLGGVAVAVYHNGKKGAPQGLKNLLIRADFEPITGRPLLPGALSAPPFLGSGIGLLLRLRLRRRRRGRRLGRLGRRGLLTPTKDASQSDIVSFPQQLSKNKQVRFGGGIRRDEDVSRDWSAGKRTWEVRYSFWATNALSRLRRKRLTALEGVTCQGMPWPLHSASP